MYFRKIYYFWNEISYKNLVAVHKPDKEIALDS